MIKKILTIAGSDCSGGAGIQADIKTITAHKMYAMSVITALTAQNTTGVRDILDINPDFVASQLDTIFEDIFPDAVKIGMVSNVKIIEVIAKKLKEYKAQNIVIDPVMVSTSGSKLIEDDAQKAIFELLLPIGKVITPNIPEAQVLSKTSIINEEDMQNVAQDIQKKIKTSVLIKGGHLENSANDLLFDGDNFIWFKANKIDNENTHGTGCTLSSAIACNLAISKSLELSVKDAKNYLSNIMSSKLDLGKGKGPLDHTFLLR